ncbi:MAG: hypothetical protein P9L92_18160 [Candidatus Electryonea clarkiae]|nr:hypothetical protein [Candidatus Electryonea clarkiae]
MNKETQQFIQDDEFKVLYENLHKKFNPIKPNINPENLQAIGLIIIKFQRLEMNILTFVRILANLGDDQKLADILTAKASFGSLLVILSSLAIEREFRQMKELKLLINKSGQAEKIRNQIVHSVWSSEPRLKKNISIQKGIKYQSETYEKGELRLVAETVDNLDTAMAALCHDYMDYCYNHGITLKGVKYID